MKQLFPLLIGIIILGGLMATTVVAQDYVGSQRCATCHSGAFNDWKASGHPYKVQKLMDGQGPVFPTGLSSRKQIGPSVDYILEPGIPQPPAGYTWDQLGFVLGGYHSNARFMDKEGYVLQGAGMQYNLPTRRWVQYEQAAPGKKQYTHSCYRCHVTGPSKDKTPEFEAYPGIEGSWAESGVGCEACHGPGSAHVAAPTSSKPSKEGYNTCIGCHARDRSDTNTRVEWTSSTVGGVATGFIRHREQGDMMLTSKHHTAGMTCASCHAPHKGLYFEMGGIKDSPKCETCHPNQGIPGHTAATCTDCHMPFAAKSADGLTPYVSEQSAHFWKVLTDPITMFDNLDTNFIAGKKYINVSPDGVSGLTLDYTCLQCHVNQDVTWASGWAKGIHQKGVTSVSIAAVPTAFGLLQNYPNPFNPSTSIGYTIPVRSNVRIEVLDAQGRLVSTLLDDVREPGRYTAEFSGNGLPSGVYFYRMYTDGLTLTKKMMLMK